MAIEIHASLSSNTLQYNFGFGKLIGKITSSSVMNCIKGIVSCIAWDKAMYSDSAVLTAISVCILLHP